MIKFYITLAALLTSNHLFAWVCPNNFNQIAAGDSIELINQQCGKPASETKSEKEPNVPQEWSYFVNPSSPAYLPPGTPPPPPSASMGPSASVRMTINFVDDKVVNISAQGMSLSSTNLCGATINVGDSTKAVKTACKDPGFVQKQATDAKPIEVITYKYDTAPPNTLIFEGGKLKERK